MIYGILDGDLITKPYTMEPRMVFVMTKLGKVVPPKITQMRAILAQSIKPYEYGLIDAGSKTTGGDFLAKIWGIIISLPCGVALISEELRTNTKLNIFYEIGLMQAIGKETLIIKTTKSKVPSDFVRTEYIDFDGDEADLEKRIQSYMTHLTEKVDYYTQIADNLGNNPFGRIDYLRRAYLLSGNKKLLLSAEETAHTVYTTLVESKIVSARSREGTWAALGISPVE